MKAAIFLLCVLSLAFCAPPDISKRSPPDISKRWRQDISMISPPLIVSKRSRPDISKRWFIDRKNANCLICCACLYLLKSILCLLFFVLEFFISRKIFSLLWRRHHWRWRAENLYLCSALMAIEQWRFFSVPHLLCNGNPIIMVISEDPWQSLAVELSQSVLTT